MKLGVSEAQMVRSIVAPGQVRMVRLNQAEGKPPLLFARTSENKIYYKDGADKYVLVEETRTPAQGSFNPSSAVQLPGPSRAQSAASVPLGRTSTGGPLRKELAQNAPYYILSGHRVAGETPPRMPPETFVQQSPVENNFGPPAANFSAYGPTGQSEYMASNNLNAAVANVDTPGLQGGETASFAVFEEDELRHAWALLENLNRNETLVLPGCTEDAPVIISRNAENQLMRPSTWVPFHPDHLRAQQEPIDASAGADTRTAFTFVSFNEIIVPETFKFLEGTAEWPADGNTQLHKVIGFNQARCFVIPPLGQHKWYAKLESGEIVEIGKFREQTD